MNEYDENDIEWIDEPLTTEDGFLNEVAANKLHAAITNIPPDYERLAHKTEWSTPFLISVRHIVSIFASESISILGGSEHGGETMPPSHPPNLEKAAGYLDATLRRKANDQFMRVSLCDINRMLHEILGELDIVEEWADRNGPLGENFIPREALFRNVCVHIRNLKREDAMSGLYQELEPIFGRSGKEQK